MKSELPVEDIRELLDVVAPVLEREWKRRRRTAADFNVFSAAGIERRERSHSAFLASLLDPKGPHAHGTLFLDGFLDLLEQKKRGPNQSELAASIFHKLREEAKIYTEYAIPKGFIDVLIRFGDKALVIVENKVFASEQPGQIRKYRQWAKRFPMTYIVFLTPYGDPSKYDKADICLSYSDLGRWLEEACGAIRNAAPRVATSVAQYASLCNKLGGVMTDTTNSKVLKLLKERAETALVLEPHVKQLKEDIVRGFLLKTMQFVTEELGDAEWKVECDEYFNGFTIRPAARDLNSYRVVLAQVTGGMGYPSHIGVMCPKRAKPAERERRRIEALRGHINMKVLDTPDRYGYIGWTDTDKDYGPRSLESLLRMHHDDGGEARALAGKVVKVFNTVKGILAELNKQLPT